MRCSTAWRIAEPKWHDWRERWLYCSTKLACSWVTISGLTPVPYRTKMTETISKNLYLAHDRIEVIERPIVGHVEPPCTRGRPSVS